MAIPFFSGQEAENDDGISRCGLNLAGPDLRFEPEKAVSREFTDISDGQLDDELSLARSTILPCYFPTAPMSKRLRWVGLSI